jgi:hypothetical protein
MFRSFSDEIHPELTFDEANIIAFNIYGINGTPFVTLEAFLVRIDDLYHNTTDPYLRRSVRSVQQKISMLTPAEYEKLCTDCAEGNLIFPANYRLPTINSYTET